MVWLRIRCHKSPSFADLWRIAWCWSCSKTVAWNTVWSAAVSRQITLGVAEWPHAGSQCPVWHSRRSSFQALTIDNAIFNLNEMITELSPLLRNMIRISSINLENIVNVKQPYLANLLFLYLSNYQWLWHFIRVFIIVLYVLCITVICCKIDWTNYHYYSYIGLSGTAGTGFTVVCHISVVSIIVLWVKFC